MRHTEFGESILYTLRWMADNHEHEDPHGELKHVAVTWGHELQWILSVLQSLLLHHWDDRFLADTQVDPNQHHLY